MKTIILDQCNDCPFKQSHFDCYSNDINTCNLLFQEYIKEKAKDPNYDPAFYIKYRRGKMISKNELILDNCPLLKDKITVSLK